MIKKPASLEIKPFSKTATGQSPQNSDILGRNKAAFYRSDTKQIPDPLGVLGGIFISFCRLDLFEVGDSGTDTLFFQSIE